MTMLYVLCFRRRPAWTDRILYRVSPNNYENVTLKVEQKSYQAHSGYVLSDHKPVTAEFVIKVNFVHNALLRKALLVNFNTILSHISPSSDRSDGIR